MNISTKAPQSLEWVAFSVTFTVFLLVNFTTHNLYADDPGIDPPDENQRFIEMGTCHTPNFGIPRYGWFVREWVNSIVELVNQRYSLRHEEPYFAITVGYKPNRKMYEEWRQRGFFSTQPFNSLEFWRHVGHYFVGRISYTNGWMINDTHLDSVQIEHKLQERYCRPLFSYPEADANEAIRQGNVSFFDHRYAHVRFLLYGWEARPYHLFLRNCQHWTYFVLDGHDTSGFKGQNLWGFGLGTLFLPEWVVELLWLL